MADLANVRDAAGQGITDPAHRAMFLASAQGVAGRASGDIQDHARAQAVEQYRGTLANTIDGNV